MVWDTESERYIFPAPERQGRVFSQVDMIATPNFQTALLFLKLVRLGSKICKVSIKIRFKKFIISKAVKIALSTPIPHFTSFYWVPLRPDFE